MKDMSIPVSCSWHNDKFFLKLFIVMLTGLFLLPVATHIPVQLLSLHDYSNVFILVVCYQAHKILNQNSVLLVVY